MCNFLYPCNPTTGPCILFSRNSVPYPPPPSRGGVLIDGFWALPSPIFVIIVLFPCICWASIARFRLPRWERTHRGMGSFPSLHGILFSACPSHLCPQHALHHQLYETVLPQHVAYQINYSLFTLWSSQNHFII